MKKTLSKLLFLSILLLNLSACSFLFSQAEEENQSHLAVTINTSDYPSYNISVMLVDQNDIIQKSITKEKKSNFEGYNSISFVFSELDIGTTYKVVANAQVGKHDRYVGESDYMTISDPNYPINLTLHKYNDKNPAAEKEQNEIDKFTSADEPSASESEPETRHEHFFKNERLSVQSSNSILKTRFCECGITETESIENVIGLETFKLEREDALIEFQNSELILVSDPENNSIRPFLISKISVTEKFFSTIIGPNGITDSNETQTKITWKQAVDFCNQITRIYMTTNDFAYSSKKNVQEQRLGFRLPMPEELRYAMDNGYITIEEGTREWCYEIDNTDTTYDNNAYLRHGAMASDGSTEYFNWETADSTITFRVARWIQ